MMKTLSSLNISSSIAEFNASRTVYRPSVWFPFKKSTIQRTIEFPPSSEEAARLCSLTNNLGTLLPTRGMWVEVSAFRETSLEAEKVESLAEAGRVKEAVRQERVLREAMMMTVQRGEASRRDEEDHNSV